jgi:hypothetical protein
MSYVDTGCQQALILAKATVDKNTEILALNTTANNKYQADLSLYSNYVTKLVQWTNKTGSYSNWQADMTRLTNEERPWNNCVDWLDTSAGKHDDYCVNDIGVGWYHAGQTGDGCSLGFGKGLCKRTASQVNIDLNADGYISTQPIPVLNPSPATVTPTIPQGNITCCNNLINVTNSLLQSVDITQQSTCNGPTASNAPVISNAPITPTVTSVPDPSVTVTPPIVPVQSNSVKLIAIAMIIVLLLLLLSSIFAFVSLQ